MQGSLRQRGEGSWQLRVHAGRDVLTGKKLHKSKTFRGTKRYACQVLAGRDPRTGKKRYLAATATSEREAHRLIHKLVAEVESGSASPGTGRQ